MSFPFNDLNEIQQQAVKAVNGPILILAGAGSGKTRTLTYRIAYLIKEKKVLPSQILAVTFTNKAANEMKSRIAQLLNSAVVPLWIGTFHSVCARILRIEAEHAGYTRNFTIYDVDDQVRALKKVLSSLGMSQQQFPPRLVQSRLSRIKNQFIYPEDLDQTIDEAVTDLERMMPNIYRAYQKYLKESNAFDFDDLLMKPLELFDQFPDIKQKYADKFKYVMIDEYQDTNRVQYLFAQKITNGHKNICVVGDEDQSIYGWRGADINNILNFHKDYPEAQTFKLEENYRSDRNILDAANSVVKNNLFRIGKNLWTAKETGDKIILYSAGDEVGEAKFIVEQIHEEMYNKKRSFNEMAILYRTNAQSRIIEDALRRNAISYTVVGGTKFYDRKEIKDLLAYLKLIVNPADNISLKRIINFPLRGIGETTVGKIEKFSEIENITLFAAMQRIEEIASISPAMKSRVVEFVQLIQKFIELRGELSAEELASTLASESGLIHHYKSEYDHYESETRIGNIKELFNSIKQFMDEHSKDEVDANLATYLEEVSLLTDVDTWNSDTNSVTLMTLHAAKGLEFPVVFIAGMVNGLIPLERTMENVDELEEERRLLYVGMTRAQKNLYLSYANRLRRYGNPMEVSPSLFLREIPNELMIYKNGLQAAGKGRKKRGKNARRSAVKSYFSSLESQDTDDVFYKVGQPVYHATFGKGKIVRLEGSGDSMKITVQFQENKLIKKLVKQYANLSALEE